MVWTQSSFAHEHHTGCLYLVPTPIGNLQDMTYRAVETLKQVDYIAAEDTRHSRKLLHYFNIEKKVVSYHEHNKDKSGQAILRDLREGQQVALVTDAGMPGISDPGTELVQLAAKEQIPVISLPGANAALTALVASGLPTEQFTFVGFLDRKQKKREAMLLELKRLPSTLLLYESPHRLKECLKSIYQVLGDRQAAIVRELTKKHEEYIRGTLQELIAWSDQETIRGEFCIVIAGNHESQDHSLLSMEEAPWWQPLTVIDHVDYYVQQGDASKEAIKKVAKERQSNKREIYQQYHVQGEE